MRPASRLFFRILAVLAVAALASGLPPVEAGAQAIPRRPQLKAGADTNDWGAYFDLGVDALRSKTGADFHGAFYWAARLNPERAEPLFAQWVAFHKRDVERWLAYSAGDPKVRERRDVQAADSLRLRARIRNPFVAQTLEVTLFNDVPGQWAQTDLTNGWLAYSEGNMRRAAQLFAHGIARDPARHAFARELRAQILVGLRQYDSALVEMRTLRAELERRDASETRPVYQSKEFIDYSIGFLEGVRGDTAAARAAMQRALAENLAFHPAHIFLGDEALRLADAGTAIYHYEEALAIDSLDAVVQHHYALALMRVGRLEEAATALRRATTLEPFYAAPWFQLGRVLERRRDADGARMTYRQFVASAPRSDAARVREARARLAALDAAR